MADSTRFQVPERFRPGLIKIASVKDEMITGLLDSLEKAPPSLRVEDMARDASKNHDIEFEDALEIFGAVRSLYSLRDTEYISIDQLTLEMSSILQEELEQVANLSSQEVTIRFQQRLSSFLETRSSLEISSKAFNLLNEYENLFLSCRILTDIRPVFNSDIDDGYRRLSNSSQLESAL